MFHNADLIFQKNRNGLFDLSINLLMKSKIFINYRKDDSPWNSLALYQELIKYFPKENIFKDFNTIEPGTDFVESIEEALESCDVLLVLLSEHWLEIKDKKGNIRINNPDDFVRIEIATALKRNIIVIPVLFDDAVLPQASELPDDLKKLARRQTIEIDKTRFEADTAKLVGTIKNVLAKKSDLPPTEPPQTGPTDPPRTKTPGLTAAKEIAEPEPKKWLIAAAVLFVVLIIIAVIFGRRLFASQKGAVGDSITTIPDTSSAIKKPVKKSVKKNLPAGYYKDFQSAYNAVFENAASNFVNIKGDPFPNNTDYIQNYKPKITIVDKNVEPSNIFPRNNEWAFRFVIQGSKDDEATRFQDVDQVIQNVYRKNELPYQKTQIAYGKGDVSLASYEYKSAPYRVDMNRMIDGNNYFDEVIIYHSTE